MPRKHEKKRMPWADDFPNGKSANAYGDYANWSNRRWAWEFLRRNPDYIRACSDIGIVPGKKITGPRFSKAQSIAQMFGRIQLKHYMEPYGEDDKTRNWTVESVIDSSSGVDKGAPTEFELTPGRVSMLFDLSNIDAAGTASITAMLSHAREILYVEAQRYKARNLVGPAATRARLENTIRPKPRRPERSAERRLLWLRVYDALEIYRDTTEKANDVFITSSSEEDNEVDQADATLSARKKLSKLRVRAKDYVSRDYLSLVPLDYIKDGAAEATMASP